MLKTVKILLPVSTAYVFNGEGRRPYAEDDPVYPIGVYGKSKEAGESAIRQIVSSHVIIRTSWLYGKYGKNFVYTMLRLFHEKDSIGVVADQQGTPTWTKNLAGFIKTIISGSRQLAESTYGTYHYSGEGETSWYDFAEEIYALGRENGIVQRACEINPILKRMKRWHALALEDFDSAKYMFDGNRYGYVYFMCQQAVEKELKK